MRSESVEFEDVVITDARGNKRNVCFTREYTIYTEVYGSDADGNRGLSKTFIDDDFALDVQVYDENDREWYDLSTYHPDEQEVIMKGIDQWLQDNDPDCY